MMTTDGKHGDMISQNCLVWIINKTITASCVQTLLPGYLLFKGPIHKKITLIFVFIFCVFMQYGEIKSR